MANNEWWEQLIEDVSLYGVGAVKINKLDIEGDLNIIEKHNNWNVLYMDEASEYSSDALDALNYTLNQNSAQMFFRGDGTWSSSVGAIDEVDNDFHNETRSTHSLEDYPKHYEDWAKEYHTPKKQCECGKEKHGFASHSSWCELYENT